jgi:hypothetical protein
MDLKLWGRKISKIDNLLTIQRYRSKNIFLITSITPLINQIEIFNGENLLLKFKDELINENNLRSFIRYIDNDEYHYENGKLSLKIQAKKTFNIPKIDLFTNKFGKYIIPELDEKFLTLDIETQVLDNIISPIMINIFNGSNHFNFFLPDYNNIDEMINSALNNLLCPSLHNHKIYIHNFSNFDGIFLLKFLINLKYNGIGVIVKPTFKDGKMINIDIRFGNNYQYKISFRDSYLILLFSLKKLAKTFGIGEKGEFNFKSVDNLNNKGLLFFKDELTLYCKNDCFILYKIIQNFNQLIFDKWNLNINNFPTLPSVAMGLFRSKFLREDEVCIIKGVSFKDIKESYTGGSTDMFIPYGKNIFGYDINSLYPYAMKNKMMPINNMKYFEGSLLEVPFGFLFVEVSCPDNLHIPILQIHNKNRTVSPLGKFKGWFFSEELINARDNFGYKFKIIKGYTFDKANIFERYVNELYSLRLTYPKSNPMNYIAKILMNSLYGRFGLNPLLPESQIIDKDMLDDFIDSSEILELLEFDDKLFIQYIDENKIKNFNNDKMVGEINSNIAIASAITAYSRMIMADIKLYCLNNNIKILYSDTDSIFTDKPLPDNLIGQGIGQWKLEGFYKKAVFLAPKVYGLIDILTGKEVIKIK